MTVKDTYSNRQKRYRALEQLIREIYEINDYPTLTAREIKSCLAPRDRKDFTTTTIAIKLKQMKDVKVVGDKKGVYIYKLKI